MKIKTLSGISQQEILEVFNESFSDYSIPFQLTASQLASNMLANNVDLDLSIGVFDHGKIIGFVLHGFKIMDGCRMVYNGGTGVIPSQRGQGLTKKMYAFILPILKEKEIDTLILEVISNNTPAIKSYEHVGYSIIRGLRCYKGSVGTLSINKNLIVKKIVKYDWNLMESFWDFTPTWQNSKSAIQELNSSVLLIGAYLEKQLVGYVIYNPTTKRLQQMAVDENFRKIGVASTLMAHLAIEFDPSITIINVDKRNQPIDEFFKKIGLECFLEQLEMSSELGEELS